MNAELVTVFRSRLVAMTFACLALCVQPAFADGPTCPASLHTADIIDHDLSISFCELCDVGTVRLEVENPFRASDDADFSQIVVTENFLSSGLTYVPGTTSFNGINVGTPPTVEPVVTGVNGSLLTWTLDAGFVMTASPSGNPGTRPRLEITFNVRRHASLDEEGLLAANRTIEGGVTFAPSCAPTFPHSDSTGFDVLPLREPEPQITKLGRNVDAGQGVSSYSAPVYGHENDDVIWRIEVRNDGDADLQDLVLSDQIAIDNFEINYVCDSEADATSTANGSPPARCLNVGATTQVPDLSVAAVFGGGGTYIAAPAGGSGYYYFVGKLIDSCVNRTNTVYDVEWGCQVDAPAGGIAATSSGQIPGDNADLNTQVVPNDLDVDVFLTGINESQPMGATGVYRIRIRNTSGGTIKGGAGGLRLSALLPAQYVIDPTFTPAVSVAPAYGNAYPGMLDEVAWTNAAANTFPLTTNDPALPLSNTDLDFVVTSSTTHPQFADQVNMLRHGDELNIRFRTVLIDPTYYDKEAYLDVRTESPTSDPANTDPDESFAIDAEVGNLVRGILHDNRASPDLQRDGPGGTGRSRYRRRRQRGHVHPDQYRTAAVARASAQQRRPQR